MPLLETVVIDEGVEIIEDWVFYGCTKLIIITIPNSIKEISDINSWSVFSYCDNLKEVIIKNTEISLSGEPWGADDAKIIYVDPQYEDFAINHISNKNQEELEELMLKNTQFLGTFDEFLEENSITRETIKQEGAKYAMTYIEYLKHILVYYESWLKVEYQVSLQGGEGKSVEELEELFIEKNGGKESFENFLKEQGITKEQYFENICNTEGFRTKEDFLKYKVFCEI